MRSVGLIATVSLASLVACKAELAGGDGTVDASSSTTDAPGGGADAEIPLGPWPTPGALPGASEPAVDEDDPVLAPSGLELVFARGEADGTKHLYRMTRASTMDAWSPPERLGVNASGADDQTPRMSGDGKTLYFASSRAGGVGGIDVYMATRQNANEPFAGVAIVPGVNDTAIDRWLTPCDGDRYLMISRRGGDADEDLFEGVAGMAPARLPISSGAIERGLTVSPDCLTMYFASNQGGSFQLYTSTRTAVTDAWPEEVPFVEVNVAGAEHEDPFVSIDRRTFLVTVVTSGQKDIYIATR